MHYLILLLFAAALFAGRIVQEQSMLRAVDAAHRKATATTQKAMELLKKLDER